MKPTLCYPFITFYALLVMSFIELIQYLFSIPGGKVFLSGKLSLDPLERYFGCVRQSNGSHDNPNAAEFCKITQSLRVANSVCASAHIRHGNCRGHKRQSTDDLADEIKENIPLPKRPRNASKAAIG